MYNDWLDDAQFIAHSAKGSTWKNHKYIAIADGNYIYPDEWLRRPQPRQNYKNINARNEYRKNNPVKKTGPMDGLFSAASNLTRGVGRAASDVGKAVGGFVYNGLPSYARNLIDASGELNDNRDYLLSGKWIDPRTEEEKEAIRAMDRERRERSIAEQQVLDQIELERQIERKMKDHEAYVASQPEREARYQQNVENFKNVVNQLPPVSRALRNPGAAVFDSAQNLYESLMNGDLDASALADEGYSNALNRNRRRR